MQAARPCSSSDAIVINVLVCMPSRSVVQTASSRAASDEWIERNKSERDEAHAAWLAGQAALGQ